jgi:hypothetical protein
MPKASRARCSRARSGPLRAAKAKASRTSTKSIKDDEPAKQEEPISEEDAIQEYGCVKKQEYVKEEESILEEPTQEEKYFDDEKYVKEEEAIEEDSIEDDQYVEKQEYVKDEEFIKQDDFMEAETFMKDEPIKEEMPRTKHEYADEQKYVKDEEPILEDDVAMGNGETKTWISQVINEQGPMKEDGLIKQEKEDLGMEKAHIKRVKHMKQEKPIKKEERVRSSNVHGLRESNVSRASLSFVSRANKTCQLNLRENYLLLVQLKHTSDPVINRLLSVPSNFTFEKLHHVLQVAFEWTNSHMYQFKVNKILSNDEVSFSCISDNNRHSPTPYHELTLWIAGSASTGPAVTTTTSS